MKIVLYDANNEATNTVEKCAGQCAATCCGHFNFGVADRADECRLYYATHECEPSSNPSWVYYGMITAFAWKLPAATS